MGKIKGGRGWKEAAGKCIRAREEEWAEIPVYMWKRKGGSGQKRLGKHAEEQWREREGWKKAGRHAEEQGREGWKETGGHEEVQGKEEEWQEAGQDLRKGNKKNYIGRTQGEKKFLG